MHHRSWLRQQMRVAARAKISDVIEPLSRGRSAWQKLATIRSSLR